MSRVSCLLAASALLATLVGCPASFSDDAGATTTGCAASADDLTLPPGFCASVFASDLGYARHLAVRDNGDVYVALRGDDGGVVALRDTDGDGRADKQDKFGPEGGSGIGIRDGYLYFAMPTRIVRYRLDAEALVPPGEPETVVSGFQSQRVHASKTVTFDEQGRLYVNIGVPSNACQSPQRSPGVAGRDPCPELQTAGGIWRYPADKTGLDAYADGEVYGTGIRNALANDWHPAFDRLYAVQHGRDQLSELWPDLYTVAERVELPAEELLSIANGDDFGWPYCYYDPFKKQKVLGPEYGGDGNKVGRCADAKDPVVGFPAHWAPNDLLIYTGRQFPAYYRHGAFVAFHGSWNRAPEPQRGFNVAFVRLSNDKAVARDGKDFEVFADGFAGTDNVRSPGDARYRPSGLAQTPDGALLVSDSRTGRVWRVEYQTPAESGAVGQ